MAELRPGYYLEDNPPFRSQFRAGRRAPVKPVVCLHTAQSGTDREGEDPKAENVASFIQRRSDPGSYHLLGDADSIIQLIRFENEAFHDRTGSNRWAIGISLAMNAADWPSLSAARRAQFVSSAAKMSAIAARWLVGQGLEAPVARLLTKEESDRDDASGFISHARRDPTRRSDPGSGFPWSDFFRAYSHELGQPYREDTIDVVSRDAVRQLQRALTGIGVDPGPDDGIPGPKTRSGLRDAHVVLGGEALVGVGELERSNARATDLEAQLASQPNVDSVVAENEALRRTNEELGVALDVARQTAEIGSGFVDLVRKASG